MEEVVIPDLAEQTQPLTYSCMDTKRVEPGGGAPIGERDIMIEVTRSDKRQRRSARQERNWWVRRRGEEEEGAWGEQGMGDESRMGDRKGLSKQKR